jgi:FkbM family methyltransferase
MSRNISLDIRIINFIVGKFESYINWKNKRREIEEQKNWLEIFKDKDFINHRLSDQLVIRLFGDSVLSKLIFDDFETDEIRFLNEFLSEGDIFLDIGANIGLFSLYASKKVGGTGIVYAFEPATITYGRLVENIRINGIGNIQPIQIGLSDKEEILELNVSTDGHEAWNTFVSTEDTKFSIREKVQVKSLDHFLIEQGIELKRISLIKLDVEGFEINVLKGSINLLETPDAPVFMVEFTDENAINAGNCCHELYKYLLPYGYVWYTFDPVSRKLNKESIRLSYPYNNLIAVKKNSKHAGISKFMTVTQI